MTRKQVMEQLVKKEAKNLKKNATLEEIKKLNFAQLFPQSVSYCVYGQLTGDCNSQRASELINKCCDRVYEALPYTPPKNTKLNGKPSGENRSEVNMIKYWSPIEVYIQQTGNQGNGNNEKLIKYLKGESIRLNLK